MKEYKFRYWDTFDKKEPKMVYFNFNKLLAGTVYPGKETVMQYTGLTDKNGKDIYEGDIVSYLDGNEWSTESGYECEEFLNRGVINFDTEYARYDVTNKEGVDYEDVFEGGGDFEVLGNIYENPELLNTTE